jgi:hypothetical protein
VFCAPEIFVPRERKRTEEYLEADVQSRGVLGHNCCIRIPKRVAASSIKPYYPEIGANLSAATT